MLETMLGYIVEDYTMMSADESNVILPSMTINQDSKTPYTDATQVMDWEFLQLTFWLTLSKKCFFTTAVDYHFSKVSLVVKI